MNFQAGELGPGTIGKQCDITSTQKDALAHLFSGHVHLFRSPI